MNRDEWDALSPDEQYGFAYSANWLTDNYDGLMKLIPECLDHGYLCVPHAKEWVERASEVLSQLAGESPYWIDRYGERICFFCHVLSGEEHEDYCIWKTAKELEAMESE